MVSNGRLGIAVEVEVNMVGRVPIARRIRAGLIADGPAIVLVQAMDDPG